MPRRRATLVRVEGKPEPPSSWSLIGGEWLEKLPSAEPEVQLRYAILKQAVQTLVDKKDGHKRTGAGYCSTAKDFINVRKWMTSPVHEALVSFTECCVSINLDPNEFRELLRAKKLL